MASSNSDLAKTPKRRSGASRKVRNVARIGGFSDPAPELSWISVNKTGGEASESVTLSFRDQSTIRKECFELDCFYDQNEDNGLIFSREVKPLIAGVQEGCNATVVALGARGSGKTSLVQGSSEKPGLAAMAMDEIISVADKNRSLVTISSYEVYQDHIYDVLDPSRSEVLVLGNTQGSIRLKGLSQVPVKSMSEFEKLYVSGCASSRKPTTKGVVEISRRSHKGLIIYLSSPKEDSDTPQVAKLNFVDVAGYEDTRRKSIDGGVNHIDNSKINKSIYAMLNVIQAVSSTGVHVPYRESKLTYLLQDSLGGTSKVLTITCLKPSFCQDSIYMLSLVSRSSQNNNEAVTGSKKKRKGLTRPAVPSQKAHMPMSAAKKQTISRVPLSNKKVNGSLSSKKGEGSMTSAMKGRKPFDERNRLTKSVKASAMSNIVSTVGTSVTENSDKVESVSIVTDGTEQLTSESTLSHELNSVEPISIVEKDELLSDESKQAELSVMEEMDELLSDESKLAELSLMEEMDYLHLGDPKLREDDAIAEKDHPVNEDDYSEELDPCVDSGSQCALALVKEDHDIEKENNHFQDNGVASPPISARLEELANNLKSLCSTTPMCTKMQEEKDDSSYNCIDIAEPKTPFANQDTQQNDRWEVANVNSPWETLSVRSTGVKQSLVQEYLSFLNTASKEDLKRLKGIGEKRATYILECREGTPEPFKSLDDLQEIGLSAKQAKNLMKKAGGGLFD